MLWHPSPLSYYLYLGFLREQSGTFVGREALGFFSRQRYILSGIGVDADAAITDLTLEDNEVKQVMDSASTQVILMTNQSKMGMASYMQGMAWKNIHHFVMHAMAGSLHVEKISKLKSALEVHVFERR